MNLRWVTVALALASQSPVVAAPPSCHLSDQVVSLEGTWHVRQASLVPANGYDRSIDTGEWSTARVPGNWIDAGIADPGAVWYRRTFDVAPGHRGLVAVLTFEGVDYAADVWVNGAYVGFHEGYFQTFSFEIGRHLRFGERNTIAVRVDSPAEGPGAEWSLNKRLIKGVLGHHDTRPGGAWTERGQEQNTGGIWGAVHIAFSPDVAIASMSVSAFLDDHDDGHVAFHAELVNPSTLPVEVELVAGATPTTFIGSSVPESIRPITVPPGRHRYTHSLRVDDPRLWWPREFGAADLYRTELTVRARGRALDAACKRVGFRSIAFDAETQTLSINGRRFFSRGTNYIATQWLGRFGRPEYTRDVAMMTDAHINAVRVHAHITGTEFYELCDELGLVVWQDFPLQWGYVDSPEFAAEASRQVEDMAHELGHHPSIVTWSIHNEPPWDADWMKWKYDGYDPTQNRELDEQLSRRLRSIDPHRVTFTHSATAEHPWYGWYSGNWRDYANPARTPIVSEFGAQALPDEETLTYIFPDAARWPDTDDDWALWEYHNFQRRETFEIAGVHPGESLSEFVRNSQTYQARLTALAAESLRRQRFGPVTAMFQFMFVETWPSVNWGIVDYRRRSKPGYDALRTAYQPTLISIDWHEPVVAAGEPVKFGLWTVNDLPTEFADARVSYVVRRDGTVVQRGSIPTNVPPDSSQPVAVVGIESPARGGYAISAQLADRHGQIVSVNRRTFEAREVQLAER